MIKVTKRDGRLEPIDLDKIHRVLTWGAEGLNVSVSEVELRAQLQFFEGIKTTDIHDTLIKAAADLISEESPDYQWLAARINIFGMRKTAFGEFTPPSIGNHVQNMVARNLYDKHLVEDYDLIEWAKIDEIIDHSRDLDFAYAATVQLREKYLVQNRVTGALYESPQQAYVAIAAALFAAEPKHKRLDCIKAFYDAVSLHKISLPTPIMAGVRTPTRQFSSCVLIEAGDSLSSINGASAAMVNYVSQRAGIGINAGAIRGIGAEIRGGEAFHTGAIPFYKHFQTAVKSCSQGGVRGGAATLFYPLWTWEVESLLVLKNNRGVEDNRVRQLDYGVQLNRLMYQRLVEGGDITLFSTDQVSGLYEAFFADQEEFERLYVKYENTTGIRKKTIKASELFGILASERASTGRIYIQNVDHCNTHSSFDPSVAPVKQSNLCLEIGLPTEPLDQFDATKGEIALCTLAAFNLGALENLDELEGLSEIIVRALDNLLDYQDYPHPAALKTKQRRSLGMGITNLAYYFAKNGVKYSDGSALKLTHETMESVQYFLLKASNKLAAERGRCELFSQTKYAKGLLPIDHYKKSVDKFADFPLLRNWEQLRNDVGVHGLRHSTMTALMPCETSSQITNSTNGIEPPRGYVSVKGSKDGVMRQVVPDYEALKDQYELLWEIPDNTGYLQLVAVMQKFVDQSISTNTNYDPKRFSSGRTPMKKVIQDMLTAYSHGVKCLYYHNTRDGAAEDFDCESCKV